MHTIKVEYEDLSTARHDQAIRGHSDLRDRLLFYINSTEGTVKVE